MGNSKSKVLIQMSTDTSTRDIYINNASNFSTANTHDEIWQILSYLTLFEQK